MKEGDSYAVFLRAANVGGHQVFKPSALAKGLARFGAKSIGAAGTFVFTGVPNEAVLTAAIAEALPFPPVMLVERGATVLKLVASRPFGASPPGLGETRFATALLARPRRLPRFPMDAPKGEAWQLRVLGVSGRFALCARRAKAPGKFYPNDTVEKALGVPATTRSWSTVEAVAKVLGHRL